MAQSRPVDNDGKLNRILGKIGGITAKPGDNGVDLKAKLGDLCLMRDASQFVEALKNLSYINKDDNLSPAQQDLIYHACKKRLAEIFLEKLIKDNQPWFWGKSKTSVDFLNAERTQIKAAYPACPYPAPALIVDAINAKLTVPSAITSFSPPPPPPPLLLRSSSSSSLRSSSSDSTNSDDFSSVDFGLGLESEKSSTPFNGITAIGGGSISRRSSNRDDDLESVLTDVSDEDDSAGQSKSQTLLITRLQRLHEIEKDYYAKINKIQPVWEPGLTLQKKIERLQKQTSLSSDELGELNDSLQSRLKKIPYNVLWEQYGASGFKSDKMNEAASDAYLKTFISSPSSEPKVAAVASRGLLPDYLLSNEAICATRTCHANGKESKVFIRQYKDRVEDLTPFQGPKAFTETEDQENAIQVAMMLLATVSKNNPYIRLYGADVAQVQRVHAVLLLCKNDPKYKDLTISSSAPAPKPDRVWPFNVIMSGGHQNASIQKLMSSYKDSIQAIHAAKASPPTIEIDTLDQPPTLH